MATPKSKPATIADWLATDDPDRYEIIDGELVDRFAIEQEAGSVSHSSATFSLAGSLTTFNRRPGGSDPGGWWLMVELHVQYGETLYCHDAAGFRRDRVPERPTGFPVTIRPDWVAEIISKRHEKRDLVVKPATLHATGVPHYWVLDAVERFLLVHRWTPDGYLVVQRAQAGDTVRLEPFEAIELSVGRIFGEDD